ncbi:MAG: Methyltransferase type 12 [Gammaproteobacteria bacterium]|jgi:SAM-dependent methyltransferase|nr:Methyltransferase type 12 [Gammaproteobacteria bacterium]
MSIFGNLYAQCYDLLYQDKDYQAEANYIDGIIKENTTSAKSILELGCGTGKHASLLADKSYRVHGVDRSDEMLEIAKSRANNIKALSFSQGDISQVALSEQFDVVMSLFHVLSYQLTNQALANTFKVAKQHLRSNGILMFDFWYGPAVLTQRPEVRVKRLENDKLSLIRISEPLLHPNSNQVDVKFQTIVKAKHSNHVEETSELHSLRYLFMPELEMLLAEQSFEIVYAKEWMTGKALSFDTWYGLVVARAE